MKYIITTLFIRFSGEIFDVKLKQAKLATNRDLAKVEQSAIEKKKRKVGNI